MAYVMHVYPLQQQCLELELECSSIRYDLRDLEESLQDIYKKIEAVSTSWLCCFRSQNKENVRNIILHHQKTFEISWRYLDLSRDICFLEKTLKPTKFIEKRKVSPSLIEVGNLLKSLRKTKKRVERLFASLEDIQNLAAPLFPKKQDFPFLWKQPLLPCPSSSIRLLPLPEDFEENYRQEIEDGGKIVIQVVL